jgi:hypothetical protein
LAISMFESDEGAAISLEVSPAGRSSGPYL